MSRKVYESVPPSRVGLANEVTGWAGSRSPVRVGACYYSTQQALDLAVAVITAVLNVMKANMSEDGGEPVEITITVGADGYSAQLKTD